MDFIRYGLILCIAGTGLVIAKQWAEYSEEQQRAVPATTATTASYSVPTVVESDSDLPVAAAADSLTVSAVPTAADQGQSISVETPTLALQISLVGGDIVYATLPQFETSLEEDLGPFTLLESSAQRQFIARSGLVGPDGTDTTAGRAQYTSMSSRYELHPGDDALTVDLQQQIGAVSITKRYTFNADSYAIKVEHIIDNSRSDSDWSGALYAQFKRDNSSDPGATAAGMGMKPFLGFATATDEKSYEKIEFKKLDKFTTVSTSDTYIAAVQHYFLGAWIPANGQPVDVSTKKASNGDNLIRFAGRVNTINAGETGTLAATLYLGPKHQYALEELAEGLDLTVDYGWLWWIAQPIFWAMTLIQSVIGNWGWSIILLTFGIKLAFFPLSAASYRSMAKMRTLTPKMQSIRDNYAHDKQKQSQEMMALYQKEKVNPLGGCVPMLIQMPVFIALYWVLSESVELRHSPWLGWIQDLSAMDPYFILPLIMGASMFFQQKLNPTPPDPMQAKVMQLMPIIFTVFFLFFPAGLVLYWVVNNLLSIAQQWFITRQIESA